MADNGGKFKVLTVEPRRQGCRRSIRLKTAADITRLLGKTINQAMRGEIDLMTARTIGYLGSVMIKCIEVSEISKRLDTLEAATNKRNGGANE